MVEKVEGEGFTQTGPNGRLFFQSRERGENCLVYSHREERSVTNDSEM